MDNRFEMCPVCGSKRVVTHKVKWTCPDCGFDLYNNVAAAVGVIIVDDENKVVFETRAKEPRKGFLALPGGFVNPDECAEDAVVRECREEIGFEVKDPQFLCSFPNTYPYKNIVYKTCDLFFVARVPGRLEDYLSKMEAEAAEVTSITTRKAGTIEDVDQLPMAFESSINALKVFVKSGK